MENNMQLPELDQFITRGQIASYLGVHPSTILRWEKNNNFPIGHRLTKSGSGTVRYLRSEVQEYLDQQHRESRRAPNGK
jgi:excisionase family DNA binding protein